MTRSLLRISLAAPMITIALTACGANTDQDAARSQTPAGAPTRVVHADLASGAGSIDDLATKGQLAVIATAGRSTQTPNSTDPTAVSTTQEFAVRRLVWGAEKASAIRVSFTGGIVAQGKGAPYELQVDGQPPFETGHDYLLILLGPAPDGTYMVLGGPQGRYEVAGDTVRAVEGTAGDPVISRLDGTSLSATLEHLLSLRRS